MLKKKKTDLGKPLKTNKALKLLGIDKLKTKTASFFPNVVLHLPPSERSCRKITYPRQVYTRESQPCMIGIWAD